MPASSAPMRRAVLALLVLAVLAGPAWARNERTPEEARARMEHHLKEVTRLAQHFEGVLNAECPRFGSRQEWTAYFDGEVDRVVLLMAHLEQAWFEATRTGDDDVRRTAKAPRRRLDQARALLDKLHGCAEGNGASFSPLSVWRRIERELPQRQSQIALPQ
jgi:hypothetical protein